MRQFEQDWLELGSRVARSLHYQHPRNLRLMQAAEAGQTARPRIQKDGSARSVVEVVAEELGPSLRWATAAPARITNNGGA